MRLRIFRKSSPLAGAFCSDFPITNTYVFSGTLEQYYVLLFFCILLGIYDAGGTFSISNSEQSVSDACLIRTTAFSVTNYNSSQRHVHCHCCHEVSIMFLVVSEYYSSNFFTFPQNSNAYLPHYHARPVRLSWQGTSLQLLCGWPWSLRGRQVCRVSDRWTTDYLKIFKYHLGTYTYVYVHIFI